MKLRMYMVVIAMLFSCLDIFCAKSPSKYPFAQQTNSVCFMASVLNLELLSQFKKANYDLTKLPAYTKAEWLGILNPSEVAWFKPFYQVNTGYPVLYFLNNQPVTNKPNDPHAQDYDALKKYMDECIAHGPVLPHFYTKEGKFPFGGIFKGKGDVLRFMSLPFVMVDVTALEDMKFKIFLNLIDIGKRAAMGVPSLFAPVLQTDDDRKNEEFRIFNHKTKKYDIVDVKDFVKPNSKFTNWKNEDDYIYNQTGDADVMDDTHAKHSKLLDFYIVDLKPKLFQTYPYAGIYSNLSQPYYKKSSSSTITSMYAPYEQGLYKIMLLTFGINHDNTVLLQNGKPTMSIDTYGERDVMKALYNLCNADKNHPWNPIRFNKELFLQYAIATILKNNKALKNQLKQVADIGYYDWQEYQKLVKGEYYNANGEQMLLKNIAQFIPGEEQILAFILMKNVRELWWGSQNNKMFYSLLPKIPLNWTFDIFVKNAKKQKKIKNGVAEKASFLDTWKLIRDEIQKKYERQDWVSFDGHGWVISFDPELIKLERQFSNKFYNDALNKELGITGIESIGSSDLFMFYKLTPQETKIEESEDKIEIKLSDEIKKNDNDEIIKLEDLIEE